MIVPVETLDIQRDVCLCASAVFVRDKGKYDLDSRFRKTFFARKCGYIYNVRTRQALPTLFLCIDSSPSLSQTRAHVPCNDSTNVFFFFLAAVPPFKKSAQTCTTLIACRCLSMTSRNKIRMPRARKSTFAETTGESENEQTSRT